MSTGSLPPFSPPLQARFLSSPYTPLGSLFTGYICNNCSVFEKDEDSLGWAPFKKSVGYCKPCEQVCAKYAKREDWRTCITLITAFFFFLPSFPVFFAEKGFCFHFVVSIHHVFKICFPTGHQNGQFSFVNLFQLN